MKDHILLSKVVANSTENTWAQAYSTLNLYVVASLQKTDGTENNMASSGKNILERIQREFFSLDKKNLVNIKEAVRKTVEDIESGVLYSIVLATVSQNVLYIATAGDGSVVLKRRDKIGIIGKGKKMEVVSFSGFLENNDIIILQTHGFSNKIPVSKLYEAIDNLRTFEISENIAPIIHKESQGTEAALILEYQKAAVLEALPEEGKEEESIQNISRVKIPQINSPFKKIPEFIKIFKLRAFPKKKKIIGIVIILLCFVFFAGVILEKRAREQTNNTTIFNNIIKQAQEKYDTGNKLLDVNKNLALDDFNGAKQILESSKTKFKEGSEELKRVNSLLSQINEKLNTASGVISVNNPKTVFDIKDSKLKQIGQISIKGGKLKIIDSNNGYLVIASENSGNIEKEIQLEKGTSKSITGDDNYIYVLLDNGIYRIDKNNYSDKKIVSSQNSSFNTEMDTFLGNIYTINSNDKTIDKYATPNFDKFSYFTKNTVLVNPISISIDGSIWILEASGKKGLQIRKFTKGTEDNFSITGFVSKIGKNSLIYTDSDYSNIYILDKDNQKIFIFNKNGQFQNQLDIKGIGKINSFCVDENNKTIFAATSDRVYSFGF